MAESKKERVSEEEESHRSFNFMFARMADGDAHREASAEFHGLLAKLKRLSQLRRGKANGKLSITLTASVDGDMVAIGYDVTTKEPKPPRQGTLCWLTKGGNVAFEDPRQQELKGIREVPKPKHDDEDVQDFDGETGEVLG
jgi:hypothetical protein